jgi:6-phosphogluconolactonase
MDNSAVRETIIHIGTYTSRFPFVDGRGKGIYALKVDTQSGELTDLGLMAEAFNPSYLTVDPQKRYLYTVSETAQEKQPTVSAYAIEPNGYQLQLINHQPSDETVPCFVAVHPSGRFLLDANYGSGSVSLYPIRSDGHLEPATHIQQHIGCSINPERQEGPHPHQVVFGPNENIIYVPDLGLDRVMAYRLDSQREKLVQSRSRCFELPPGQGPRHMAFHPNRRHAFVLNELGSTVVCCSYAFSKLDLIQSLSTLPADYGGESTCAAILMSQSGRHLYASNRGHDSITIFAFNSDEQRLTVVGIQSTGGRTPRDFALDPSGRILIVANQDSNTVKSFFVDSETGLLEPTGEVVTVPTPACVLPTVTPKG